MSIGAKRNIVKVTKCSVLLQLMSDGQCAKYIDGVAVHWYLDFIVPVKVLDEVHKDFGNKIIINTEASQGEQKHG